MSDGEGVSARELARWRAIEAAARKVVEDGGHSARCINVDLHWVDCDCGFDELEAALKEIE